MIDVSREPTEFGHAAMKDVVRVFGLMEAYCYEAVGQAK
jgi:hypothetical protein